MYNLRRFQRPPFKDPLMNKYGVFGAVLFSVAPFVTNENKDDKNKAIHDETVGGNSAEAMKTKGTIPVLSKEEAGGLGMMDRTKRRFDEKVDQAVGTLEEAKTRGRESMEKVSDQRKKIQSEGRDKINKVKENLNQAELKAEDKKDDVKTYLNEKALDMEEKHESQLEHAKHSVSDTLETIKHKGALMVQQAKDFISGTAEATKEKGEEVKEGISNTGEKISEKGSEMYQGAKDRANRASETIREKADDAKMEIEQTAQKAKNMGIEAKDDAKYYGKRAEERVKETMDSAYNKTKETEQNLKEKAKDFEKKAEDKFQNAKSSLDTSRDRESREKLKQTTNTITRGVTDELPSTRDEIAKQETHSESTLDRLKKPVIAAKEGIVGATETLIAKTEDLMEAAGDSIYRLTHKNPEDIKETSLKYDKELNKEIEKAKEETKDTRTTPYLSAASEAIRKGQQESIRTGKDYRQAVEDELNKLPKEDREGLMQVTTKEKQQVEYPHERMIPQDSIRSRLSTIDKLYEPSEKSNSKSQLPELKRGDLVERRNEEEPKMVNRMNRRSGDDTNKIIYKDQSADSSKSYQNREPERERARDRDSYKSQERERDRDDSDRYSRQDRISDRDSQESKRYHDSYRTQDRDSDRFGLKDRTPDRDSEEFKRQRESDLSSYSRTDEGSFIRSRDLVDQPPKVREYDAYGRKSPKPAYEYVNYVPHPDLKQSGLPKIDQEEKTYAQIIKDKFTAAFPQKAKDIDWDEEKRKLKERQEYAWQNVRDDDHPRRGLRHTDRDRDRDYSDYDRSYWQVAKDKVNETLYDDNSYVQQGLQKVKETFNDTFDTAKHYGEEAKEKFKGMYEKDPAAQYAEDQEKFKEQMRRNFQYGDRPYDQNQRRVEDQYEEYQRPSGDDSFLGKIRSYFRSSNKVADWWENRESGDYYQSSDSDRSRNYDRSDEKRSTYASSIPNSRIPATTSIPGAPNPYTTGAFKGLKEMNNTRTS